MSPDACGAGMDCCDSMFQRKRKDYWTYLHELEQVQGIAYRPLVWSIWGRAHPETEKFCLTWLEWQRDAKVCAITGAFLGARVPP